MIIIDDMVHVNSDINMVHHDVLSVVGPGGCVPAVLVGTSSASGTQTVTSHHSGYQPSHRSLSDLHRDSDN